MFSYFSIKSAFQSFIEQAKSSTFKIDFETYKIDYYISLNYDIEGKIIINNSNYPILKISNLNLFLEKLTTLLNNMSDFHYNDKDYFDFTSKNFLDYLLISLFSNMSEYDCNNSISYLDRMISAYNQNYELGKEKLIGSFSLANENIEVYEYNAKNIASMESPLYKCFILKNKGESFVLPKIHYYISNDCIYIMGIQNSKKEQKNTVAKKLDRYFRKVDFGINDVERSKNGSFTIKDISPNSLVALTLFISSFNKYKKFYLIDYLPLKYQNRIGVLKAKNIDIEDADKIQNNITNKFLLTWVRFCEHFNNADFEFYNSYLKINLTSYTPLKGNILYQLYESINTEKNIKKI